MKSQFRDLLPFLLFPLTVGAVSALLTAGSMEAFADLCLPPLSPPGWVFPVVWTFLYLLMGFAAFLVVNSGKCGNNALWMVLIFIFLAGGFVAVDFCDDPLFWNSVACSGQSYAALSGVGDVCRVFESWDLFFELNFLLRKNIPPGSASWALKPKERETCRDVLFINLITNYYSNFHHLL